MIVDDRLVQKLRGLTNLELDDSFKRKLGIKEIKDLRGLSYEETEFACNADSLVWLSDGNARLASTSETGLIDILAHTLLPKD